MTAVERALLGDGMHDGPVQGEENYLFAFYGQRHVEAPVPVQQPELALLDDPRPEAQIVQVFDGRLRSLPIRQPLSDSTG